MLKIRLLGKFDVHRDEETIAIAYPILNADISHRPEKVAGLLWPDSLSAIMVMVP